MNNLLTQYNYDGFVPSKFEPWMNFDNSPKLGLRTPNFPLWMLDGTQTSLFQVLQENVYTVVEFGSFT